MRTPAAILMLACLALVAVPEWGVAQQMPLEEGYIVADAGQNPICTNYAAGYCCSCSPRVWGDIEYILGYRKSRYVVPLVTTSPPTTPQTDAGVLGLDTTTILFGGDSYEDNPQSGVRAEIGFWLDQSTRLGVGGSFMSLMEDSVGYSASSDGSTIIARPFYNTLLDQEASQLVAFPGLVSGSIDVVGENKVTSAEAFLRYQISLWPSSAPLLILADSLAMRARSLFRLPGKQCVAIHEYHTPPGAPLTRLDFIAGYQYSQIEDSLSITNNLVSLDPAFLGQIGTTLDAYDLFDAQNEFHGATLGLKSVSQNGPWSVTMLGKIALGNMHQSVRIDGQTVITTPGGPSSTTSGGLLTQDSNIGSYERDVFAVIPEARITLNYNLSRCVNVGIGYNFLYWDRVALASNQINRLVDVTQNLPDPSYSFEEGNFFVHGLVFHAQVNH